MILTQNFSALRSINMGRVDAPVVSTVTRTVTSDPVTNPGSTVYDSEFLSETSAGSWTETDILYELGQNYAIESLTPDIASISGNTVNLVGSGGSWRVSVSKGVSRVTLTGNNAVKSRTVEYFDQFTTDSLSDVLANGILDRITEGKTDSYFANYTGNPTNLTVSPSCWLNGVDITFCPVSHQNSYPSWSAANRGAAITRRHAVVCVHYDTNGPAVGQKMRFRGSDGTMHEPTIIGSAQYGDVRVMTFGSDLPLSVTPISVAGDWMVRNVSNTGTGTVSYYFGGAYFWLDQFFRCRFQLGGALRNLSSGVCGYEGYTINGRLYENRPVILSTQSSSFFTKTPSILEGKTEFCTAAISGDSGSPVMALINGEAVLLGLWYGSNQPSNCIGNNFLNDLIAEADSNAGVSTGLTVTIATDPTA